MRFNILALLNTLLILSSPLLRCLLNMSQPGSYERFPPKLIPIVRSCRGC